MADIDDVECHWIPLESNPDMLTEFAKKIGLEGDHVFSDCMGLDEALLCMIPRPCYAVIFLFPCAKMYQAQGERTPASTEISPKVYFMKQFVSNACGSIAVMHTLLNNRDKLTITPGSFLEKFFEATKNLTPEERGKHLGVAGNELKVASEAVATDVNLSQTAAPAATDAVEAHFIAFTLVDGHLYEFDGLRTPLNHGEATEDDFLEKTAKVVQTQFMEKLPDEVNMSLITFGAAGAGFSDDD